MTIIEAMIHAMGFGLSVAVIVVGIVGLLIWGLELIYIVVNIVKSLFHHEAKADVVSITAGVGSGGSREVVQDLVGGGSGESGSREEGLCPKGEVHGVGFESQHSRATKGSRCVMCGVEISSGLTACDDCIEYSIDAVRAPIDKKG